MPATLAHYGVVADPARVRDPNRKGSVENAIGHTQATALKGRRFETIEEQNEFLEHWEGKWAASRIHGSARRQVQAMYEEERPHRHVKALTEKLVAEALAAIDEAPASPANAPQQAELDLTQAHPLIRDADEYGELFSRCASQHSTTTLTNPEDSPA